MLQTIAKKTPKKQGWINDKPRPRGIIDLFILSSHGRRISGLQYQGLKGS